MKSIHLVIPDMFLPKDVAAEVCGDLSVPALEKLLGRGVAIPSSHPSTGSGRTEGVSSSAGSISSTQPLVLSGVEGSGRTGDSLENHLCGLFGMTDSGAAPIAAISAAFDGLPEGFWLRADPMHLSLQRDQMLLLPNMDISAEEAVQICASLNVHFAGQGMEFFAPHPLRWYVRFDRAQDIEAVPLSQALGRNVHGMLPRGAEAMRWHQLFNEIQMLLFAHPLNESREARGKLTINSVWFWGGGDSVEPLLKNYQSVHSDDVFAEMIAAAADIPFAEWAEQWREDENVDYQLLVWTGLRTALQGGDLAAWRAALQDFETGYAQPLWQALRSGKIAQLRLDILGGDSIRRVSLTRGDAWAFWRRSRRLAEYSLT